MENTERQMLFATDQLSKSNAEQIVEVKEQIREIRTENKAIYSLATSIELIAKDMTLIKDDIVDVKQGQQVLAEKMEERLGDMSSRVDDIEQKPYQEFVDTAKQVKKDTISNLVRVGITAAIAILGTLLTLALVK